ncbi:hypothetical protein D3C72_2443160 [compost metagenome]
MHSHAQTDDKGNSQIVALVVGYSRIRVQPQANHMEVLPMPGSIDCSGLYSLNTAADALDG